MGVHDVQEPFHSATCLKLVKQSAFMVDFGSILGPLWEGFGRLRLPHEPRSLSSKRLKRRFDASGSLKDHFGPFLEAKWYHSGRFLASKWPHFGLCLMCLRTCLPSFKAPVCVSAMNFKSLTRHGGGKRAHAHWILAALVRALSPRAYLYIYIYIYLFMGSQLQVRACIRSGI